MKALTFDFLQNQLLLLFFISKLDEYYTVKASLSCSMRTKYVFHHLASLSLTVSSGLISDDPWISSAHRVFDWPSQRLWSRCWATSTLNSELAFLRYFFPLGGAKPNDISRRSRLTWLPFCRGFFCGIRLAKSDCPFGLGHFWNYVNHFNYI